ncbi:hypothetical protein GALL_522670 [mine drainage metagenome]|uniref:Uncharacterized protein n=1 Tax=mine drainage metagenome TaxID=410659 RepID=A0A1J5P4R5_9ZZZZ
MARIVLDARAESNLTHHLKVVSCAHTQPLSFEELPLFFKLGQPFAEFALDRRSRALHPLRAGDIVSCRENVHLRFLADYFAS